jgi:5-methylcytosine-specific restriction endonuclease McrA
VAANRALGWRSGVVCECCGRKFQDQPQERHHRQRRRDGGDRLANVMLLRRDCHRHWTEHPEEAQRRGIIVSAYADDPAAVPLLHKGRRWVLLDDLGGTQPAQPPPPS